MRQQLLIHPSLFSFSHRKSCLLSFMLMQREKQLLPTWKLLELDNPPAKPKMFAVLSLMRSCYAFLHINPPLSQIILPINIFWTHYTTVAKTTNTQYIVLEWPFQGQMREYLRIDWIAKDSLKAFFNDFENTARARLEVCMWNAVWKKSCQA